MRRSICLCDPPIALAGDVGNWKFAYTTATALPKGTRLLFDMQTKGRMIDWELPKTNLKEKKNVIWAEMPDKKVLTAREVTLPASFAPSFEFVLPSELKGGETFAIFIGAADKTKDEKKGNRSQIHVQRRRPFHLYIDPKGKGDYREFEIFALDVRGGKLHALKIVVPSFVERNKRFDVMVRFEDQYGNVTSNAPEGTLIDLSYEHLRENLSWKLFVPETGFINLPNLYFNEPGIYRIQLHNPKTGEKFYSAPIKCFAETEDNIYWGLLHGESERVDSTTDIEACLRHFRDEKALQFFATSSFDGPEETSNDDWKLISHQVAEFNEADRFSTLLGFQWMGSEAGEGVREFIYPKDNKPILRGKDAKSNGLKKIYRSHHPKELLSIPVFTMAKGLQSTFEDPTPEFERVVEIYNAWGSSECSAKEGNVRPIRSSGKPGVVETELGSIRKALSRNIRFGFVAGGLDDRGIYGPLYESDQEQYSPGLTAIIAPQHTREALFTALYNRACYATTGERIIIGFSIAGAPMGSELSTLIKPGLVFNRHITAYVAGTAPIKEILILRNGVPFQSIKPKSQFWEAALDDSEELSKIAEASPDERPPFVYYYLRVLQEDGHVGWGSPIWIDYPDMAIKPARKKAK